MKGLLALLIVLLILNIQNVKAGELRLSNIAMNTLIIADWAQTRYIADSDAYYETNNMLGRYPTTGEVNKHFITYLLLSNATSYMLPDKYVKAFEWSVTGYQFNYVTNNYSIDIGFKF